VTGKIASDVEKIVGLVAAAHLLWTLDIDVLFYVFIQGLENHPRYVTVIR